MHEADMVDVSIMWIWWSSVNLRVERIESGDELLGVEAVDVPTRVFG